MSDKPIISREADGDTWFNRMCAEKHVVPAEPLTAEQLTDHHVMFDATGGTKPIRKVVKFTRFVRVHFEDGTVEAFDHNDRISLIATKGTA